MDDCSQIRYTMEDRRTMLRFARKGGLQQLAAVLGQLFRGYRQCIVFEVRSRRNNECNVLTVGKKRIELPSSALLQLGLRRPDLPSELAMYSILLLFGVSSVT